MKRKTLRALVLCFAVCFSYGAVAQSTIICPKELKAYNEKAMEMVNRDHEDVLVTPGFRILAMSTTDRTRAQTTMNGLAYAYPLHKVYLEYKAPNFLVLFGNFRDRFRAYKWYKELEGRMSAATIVPAKVDLLNMW